MTPTIVQAVWGEIPEALTAGPPNVQAFAKARGWGYEFLSFGALSQENDSIRIAADVFKFALLSTEPGAIWVDLDCILRDGFDYIDDGAPHAGYYPDADSRECKPQPDTFVIYGPCAWWQERLDEAASRSMVSVSCWPRKLLRDNTDVVQISKECYIHMMYTITTRRANGKESRG